MGTHAEQNAATEAKIKDAFWQLYRERPLEKVTVGAIVGLAGIHRGTFYLHYDCTADVLDEIERELLAKWSANFPEKPVGKAFDAEAFLGGIVPRAAAFFQEEGDRIAVLLGPAGDPAFAERIKQTVSGRMLGLLGADPADARAAYAADFAASGVLGVLGKWNRSGDAQDAPVMADVIRQYVVRGLIPLLKS